MEDILRVIVVQSIYNFSVELKIAIETQTKIHKMAYLVSKAPRRIELIINKNNNRMKINEKVIIGIYYQPFTIFASI